MLQITWTAIEHEMRDRHRNAARENLIREARAERKRLAREATDSPRPSLMKRAGELDPFGLVRRLSRGFARATT